MVYYPVYYPYNFVYVRPPAYFYRYPVVAPAFYYFAP
jgi:hypothetical protein